MKPTTEEMLAEEERHLKWLKKTLSKVWPGGDHSTLKRLLKVVMLKVDDLKEKVAKGQVLDEVVKKSEKHYHINIIIDAKTTEEAMELFTNAYNEIIKNGGDDIDMSMHDDDYMPYVWYSCYWRKSQIEHLWTAGTDKPFTE